MNSSVIIQTIDLKQVVSNREEPIVILDGVNLSITKGETVAIVGVSGSGKSTLLGMLAGLDYPSDGKVLIDGTDITDLNEEARSELRGEKVGFVFQNFQLLPGLSALENVMLPMEVRGDREAKNKAMQWLDKVGLSQRASHLPQQLSGGEQQRVAVARAFAGEADILFADEPTGNLDTKTGDHIANLLFELNEQQGTTLILVTHDNKLASLCQRQLRMESGKLTETSL
jgi:putative ABC transport system ATP-binding protein